MKSRVAGQVRLRQHLQTRTRQLPALSSPCFDVGCFSPGYAASSRSRAASSTASQRPTTASRSSSAPRTASPARLDRRPFACSANSRPTRRHRRCAVQAPSTPVRKDRESCARSARQGRRADGDRICVQLGGREIVCRDAVAGRNGHGLRCEHGRRRDGQGVP